MWASVSICYSGGVITVTKKKINNTQELHNTKKTISRIRNQHHHGYHHHCFGYLPKPHHQLSLQSSSSFSLKCSSTNYGAAEENNLQSENKGLWQKWREKSGEMSSKLAKLGLSAVLAYGLFDAVTYTSFFVVAFLGYEKSTGQNPAANLKALIGIVILMWTGNNVTRPFRVAGAAALAPFIDKGLKQIQKYFNFPSLFNAFVLVVGIVAAPCLAVVGLLILSRLGK